VTAMFSSLVTFSVDRRGGTFPLTETFRNGISRPIEQFWRLFMYGRRRYLYAVSPIG